MVIEIGQYRNEFLSWYYTPQDDLDQKLIIKSLRDWRIKKDHRITKVEVLVFMEPRKAPTAGNVAGSR